MLFAINTSEILKTAHIEGELCCTVNDGVCLMPKQRRSVRGKKIVHNTVALQLTLQFIALQFIALQLTLQFIALHLTLQFIALHLTLQFIAVH